MPLTAIIKMTGERIVIQDDVARAKQHKDDLACPICDQPLIPVREFTRQGSLVQAFARHRDTRDHAETAYRYHTESPEHLQAKALLAAEAHLHLSIDPARVTKREFEVRLPEVMRIADVRVEVDGDEYVVFEAQLAPITPEELEERTNDYYALGYTVIWALGKDAYKDYNCRWCSENIGFFIILDFKTEDQFIGKRYAA